MDWLTGLGQALTILLVCLGVLKGLVMLRRDNTANRIGRRVLAIPLDEGRVDAVARLRKIREEIARRTRRRWWRFGELDRKRWSALHQLVDERIEEAREYLEEA